MKNGFNILDWEAERITRPLTDNEQLKLGQLLLTQGMVTDPAIAADMIRRGLQTAA